MDRLHFGVRARRRARRARLKRIAFIAWIVAVAGGVPAATVALDVTERLVEPARGDSRIAAQLLKAPRKGETVETEPAKELKSRLETAETRAADPLATTAPVPGGGVEGAIFQAAAEFGLDGSYLLSVAICESNLDPSAYNPAGYHGLFQFDQSTWAAYGYGSIYDPVAQSRTAARLLAAGQSSRWPNCA